MPFRPRLSSTIRTAGAAAAVFVLAGSLAVRAQEIRQGALSDDVLRPATRPDDHAAPGAANYGKAQPKWPGGKKPPSKNAHPLPPLVAYPTSAQARLRGKIDDTAPSPAIAMPAPIFHPVRPRVDDDPFAPTGVNAGLVRIKPYIENDVGYADNPNQAANGSRQLRGSAFWRGEVGLSAESDWANHAFNAELRGGYTSYFTDHNADAPDGAGKFTARIDVSRDTKINIGGMFAVTTQNPSSPNLDNGGGAAVLLGRPIIAAYGGSLGATQDFNRLQLGLRGEIDRTDYQNASFSNGTTQQLSLNDYDDYGLTLSVAYDLKPGIRPFVETTVDSRVYGSQFDSSGYERDSVGLAGRLGSSFELTRLLTGDIAVGYAQRHYQDPRLADLRGPTFDASLVWTVSPLTKVSLRGLTLFNETTVPGASGDLSNRIGLELSHALLRNLTLTAAGSIQTDAYQGTSLHQTTMDWGLKAEYSLTRSIVIKGSFTHERLLSTSGGTDYTANVFLVGLRLQR